MGLGLFGQLLTSPKLPLIIFNTVRMNLINHLVGFILCKFSCILAIRNPVFRWESCKGSVYERVWRIAQVCAKKQGFAARSRAWLAAATRQIDAHVPSMPEAEAACQLFITGQKFQASQAVCSWLELATQPSREVKLLEHPVWQNMTFHISSHPTIYIPLYPWFKESYQREFWERNPRENKIDSSTIFT